MQNVPWKEIGKVLSEAVSNAPAKGKLVRVAKGKYKGVIGVITWHGKDKYYNDRYRSGLSAMLSNAIGITGYRCRIQPEDGEAFFTACENLDIDERGAIIKP
jgi:hypothetical protein